MIEWVGKTVLKMLLIGFATLHILYIINQFLPIDQATLSLESRGITKSSYKNYETLYEQEKVKLGQSGPLFYIAITKAEVSNIPYPKIKWLGLNNQYHHFLAKMLKFDFGVSRTDGKSAIGKVFNSLKWTALYVLLSLLSIVMLTRYMGRVLSKSGVQKQKTSIINFLLITFYSIPEFWIATLMVIFLSNKRYGLHLFSIASYGTQFNLADIFSRIWPMVLCSVIGSLAYFIFMYRNTILDENKQPYFMGAMAKGLSKSDVIKIHTAPNAFFIMIATIFNSLPSWLAGSVILENIFNIPGMGRLLFTSYISGDWQVLYSLIFLVSLFTTLGFALGDFMHSKFNPKAHHILNY
jgi:peptide/nickel transport system permease protein